MIYRSIIVAILAAFLSMGSAHAGTANWQISEKSGEVFVESSGSVLVASRAMPLKAGDTVSTSASGRAVIVRGGEYVIISPKSRIRITQPEETGSITQIFQSIGSVLFKIKKKETPHFGVKTPYLAAVVKGTTFNVTVTQEGATVQVTEGRVEVSTLDGGASDMIVPGGIGRIDANDRQLLKVLGTDEKSIRSPLPTIDNTTPEATPEATPEEGVSSEMSGDSENPKSSVTGGDDNGAVLIGTGDTMAKASEANREAETSFSGRIDSAIMGEPVSIAVATEGLISNSQVIDRGIDNRVAGNPEPAVGGADMPVEVGAINSGNSGDGDAALTNGNATAGNNVAGSNTIAGGSDSGTAALTNGNATAGNNVAGSNTIAGGSDSGNPFDRSTGARDDDDDDGAAITNGSGSTFGRGTGARDDDGDDGAALTNGSGSTFGRGTGARDDDGDDGAAIERGKATSRPL